MTTSSPYRGRRISLATMHGKERSIAPVMLAMLGAEILRPPHLDTDVLGTFTGEIERVGTIGEVAISKARMGMQRTGLKIGIGSEGTYGPHPYIPFVTSGSELMVFIDDERHLVIFESLIDDRPCFEHLVTDDFAKIEEFLSTVGFPSQGVIVSSPNQEILRVFFKGLQTMNDVHKAYEDICAATQGQNVLVQTDMRAHMNPRRMSKIGELTRKLCDRIMRSCPRCTSPGFGKPGNVEPLPCSWCGEPTSMSKGRYFECISCDFTEFRAREDELTQADPTHCPHCNP